ncbi:MAG: TIGR01548 family HAD-type hydrolase [Candidatus Sumerlaeia bacterium]|nr:TIGR01548 family HAD-type hydrolase [Candidatus Sumerlaeia bacterium]
MSGPPSPPAWLAAGVASISSYKTPQHGAPIDLRLDANEGATPPRALADAVAAAAPDVFRRYPDATELAELLAERFAVAPNQVLVTAGADDGLDRAMRATLGPGRTLLATDPTFEMIPRYAAIAGGAVRFVPWPRAPFPTEAIVAAIDDTTRCVAVVSPNNPTGLAATADDLRRVSAAAPRALVVLDHAYAEFGDEDLTAAALALPNVVVARTLSKAWGLAGLRVGYLVGRPEHIAAFRAAGGPYAVSRPSVAVALAHLRSGEPAMHRFVSTVRHERDGLRAELERLGAECTPSQANCVFVRTPRAHWLWQALAGLGIAVRAFPGRPGLEDALRISLPGDAGSFDRLLEGCLAALAPEVLLFDLDGVLADVSQSYRRAIVETCAHYGVTATREDVARAKAAGNANNDWVLTRRLLAARGVDVPLADVTARFELFYQGTDASPGLRRLESLIGGAGMVARLAARLPLGIVTGRPRADAERFLHEHGIAHHFRGVVAMEDGPAKPDPAPVRLLLERLGAKRAWLVGDTVDDVRAARAAGVVPIGVPAPGDDAGTARPVLTAAGAARVLESIDELERLLP